jgi:hypothetical protein
MGGMVKAQTAGWKYWLGCAAEAHAARMAAAKGNGAVKPAAPAKPAPVLPRTAGGGAAAPQPPRAVNAAEEYRENIRKGMSPAKALERFYEVAGEPKLARDKA